MADFQYFNIMDVDPNFADIEEGVYELRINKLEGGVYTPQSGKSAGVETYRVKGDFVIVNHPTFAGRRLWNTFWLSNKFDQISLRKLADRTGVVQNPGEALEAWLQTMSTIQPTFKAKINSVDDVDWTTHQPKVDEITGKVQKKAVVNWREIFPA